MKIYYIWHVLYFLSILTDMCTNFCEWEEEKAVLTDLFVL